MFTKAKEGKLVQEVPGFAFFKEHGRSLRLNDAAERRLATVVEQPLKDIIVVMSPYARINAICELQAIRTAICFVTCASCLFAMLLAALRRNCFFFRWRPEKRFLALLVSPALLIVWPIVLYA